MQKALVQMNLQLPVVISDITGVTGLRIFPRHLAGRTDPQALAEHRDHRCQASVAEITAASPGIYRPEHVFKSCNRISNFIDTYQRQLAACDARSRVQKGAKPADRPVAPPTRTPI